MFRRAFIRWSTVASFAGLAERSVVAAGQFKDLELVECPRDAMQGLRDFVPTEDKIRYINALLKVGFHTVDCGSFVSAPAVPQMADTAEVLRGLDMGNTQSKLLVVVANLKGAMLACQQEKVTYVGYALSASETFQKKNTKRDIATALQDLEKIANLCKKHNKKLVTYLSMAFGNPYGEPFSVDIVDDMVQKVVGIGCDVACLADTVGVSDGPLIKGVMGRIVPKYPTVRFGGHFHSGTTTSSEKITAALEVGCRRLDSAIGGMGGCPFAKSTLVGNVPTEAIIDALESNGIPHGLDKVAFAECCAIKHQIFGVAVRELLLATVLRDEKAFSRLVTTHFNRHDTHNVGYLEKPEFSACVKEVFAELGEEVPTDERIDRAFTKLDMLDNGVITLDEYMLGARKLLSKRLKESLGETSAEKVA